MSARVRSTTSDGTWKLTIIADTPEEVFEQAARSIAKLAGTVSGPPGAWQTVKIRGRNLPTILVEWANELIGLSEMKHESLSDVRILELGPTRLCAEVRGRPVYRWTSPLSGAIRDGARFELKRGAWRAAVHFDK